MSALAREVEGGANADAALFNLKTIALFNRLMLAGLLADLTYEHYLAVRESDIADPDPTLVLRNLMRFEQRCKVLFTDGLIMSDSMENTFTASIIAFYKKPTMLFAAKHAVLFAMPDNGDHAALFEPLDRIRAIVGNVIACLKAAFPLKC